MTLVLGLYAGAYKYMDDLMKFDCCRAVIPTSIPSRMCMVQTPLDWQEWARSLARHLDGRFSSYIVEGFRGGFWVGFQYPKRCKSAKQNRPSRQSLWLTYKRRRQNRPANDVEQGVVREYLAKECAEGRVLGPLPPETLPQVQVSPIRVIAKDTTGKWRLFVNVSHPEPRSVNDGIDMTFSSLSYVSVLDAAKIIVDKGRGALLAKVDIRSAYSE